MGNVFSAIILVLIILVVIVVATVLLLRTTPTTINNTATINPGTLSEPCGFDPSNTTKNIFGSTGICQPGFICGPNKVCIANLGTRCNTLSDCSPQATVCSGRCANEPTGGINQLCPCGPTTQCVPQTDGFNRCKGINGSLCVTADDCIADCINGVCGGGLAEGSSCISQLCAPGLYCDPRGFCQQTGIITGQQNAFCTITNSPGCDTGLNCVDNRCANAFGILASNCRGQICNQPLICTVVPPIPGSGTTRNTEACLFLDNNLCINNCPGNFVCTTQGIVKKCLGERGQACIANNNCIHNVCSTMSGLLHWTGTTWVNIATPPTDIFIKMLSGPINIYMLGATGIWRYNGNTWVLIYGKNTSVGSILDFSINTPGDVIHLLILTLSGDTIVVDGSLTPINNFGTPTGQLIVAGDPVTIANISFSNFGDIYSNDASGNVYKNATFLGNFGTRIRAYQATTSTANDFVVVTNNGILSQGELGAVTFPIFRQPPIGGAIYNIIANYDIYIQYITDPTTSQLVHSASGSDIYMIASADNVNYQIIWNSSNVQSTFPGYVDANSLVTTFNNNLYLYSPRICN